MERLDGIVEILNEEMEMAEGGLICGPLAIWVDDDGDGEWDRLIIIYYEC